MSLEKLFSQFEELHREVLVEYDGLTVGKKKVCATRLRKALMEISKLTKEMRAEAITYKEKL